MEAIIIETKNKSDLKFWLELARKTGNNAKYLSPDEIEDVGLTMLIKEGMKTENVSRESVMKSLET